MQANNSIPAVSVSRKPQIKRCVITIQGRPFAVKTEGQRVTVIGLRGPIRQFKTLDEYRDWFTSMMIFYREMDERFSPEVA